MFVFGHGLFRWKLKPSVDREHARKLLVVDPDSALLCRRRHKAHGHDLHALRVEQMAVGHGGGVCVVYISNFKQSSDFWLGGRAHCVWCDRDDGHRCSELICAAKWEVEEISRTA